MLKKFNPQPLFSYKSYKISDACRIYKDQKLHPQTVRDWIKEGKLKAFFYEGDFYIYGAVLKEFFTNRNQQNKEEGKLGEENFRCGKCKTKQPPLNHVITKLTFGRNNCLLAFGICVKCAHEIHRNFKREKLAEIHEIFQVQLDEVSSLCNSSNSTNETDINLSQKVGVSQPSENENPDKEKTISASTNETEQLTLFDFIN